MIKSFTFINYLGDSIYVDLFNPEDSGLAITNVEGLGPVKSTINTTPISTGDGSIYNSARKEERNIVFTITFFQPDGNLSIEDIRQMTYRFFPLKKPVTVLIETDNRILYTVGYVESNEPNIFSEAEDTQISLICPDSNFYSYDPSMNNYQEFFYVKPLFHFPFSNESFNPAIVFGNITTTQECYIYYDGDSEAGVTITIEFDTTPQVQPNYITIGKIDSSEQIRIDLDKVRTTLGDTIQVGDKIILSTSPGNKKILYIKNGHEYSILNSVERSVDWFLLHRGENTFIVESDMNVRQLTISINYSVIFEGV